MTPITDVSAWMMETLKSFFSAFQGWSYIGYFIIFSLVIPRVVNFVKRFFKF